MPTRRWFVPLLAAVLLVAGCSRTAPPSVPVPVQSIAPGDPSLSPSVALVEATPSPSSSCPATVDPAATGAGSVVINLPLGQQEIFLAMTGYQDADGNLVTVPSVEPGPLDGLSAIGGQDVRLAYRPFSGGETDAEAGPFESLTMAIEGDAGLSVPLVPRLDATGATVTIPDVAIRGRLIVAASWSDGCVHYMGLSKPPIEVAPAAVAAACPDAEGILRQVVASQDVRVGLGGARAGLGTMSWAARYVPANAADQVGPFGSFEPKKAPVVVASGTSLPLRILDPGYRVTSLDAFAYRRDDVVDATGQVRPTGAPPMTLPVSWRADGTVEVTMPDAPGRYVLDLELGWERPCWIGHGQIYLPMTTT